MKQVLVLNAGGSDNLGDKALGVSMCKMLESKNCKTYFLNFSSPTELSMEHMPQNLPKSKPRTTMKSLVLNWIPRPVKWFMFSGRHLLHEFKKLPYHDLDMVYIGGGQLILSYKHFKDFVYAMLMWFIIVRIYAKCPIVIFSVGVGDQYTLFEKFIYSFILKRCKHLYIRDYESISILKDNFNVKAKYVPDVAFSYSMFFPKNTEKKSKTALIGIYDFDTFRKIKSSEMTKKEYMEQWSRVIMEYEKEGYETRLVYTTYKDKMETIEFAQFLKLNYTKEICIANTDTLENFTNELSQAQVIYSGRMHALILGLEYGCQVQPFILSNKLNNFYKLYVEKTRGLKDLQLEVSQKMDDTLNVKIEADQLMEYPYVQER